MKKTIIITIDGPAGAGKTTVSKQLASRLGYIYVDTGSLYRGIAYEVCRSSVNWQDDNELYAFLLSISFELKLQPKGEYRLFSSCQDITDYIRSSQITMLSSDLSAKKAVRDALLEFQRKIGKQNSAVFEGRDMGTVVFPDADYKFFLSADLNVRALRRYNEIVEKQSSQNLTLIDVEQSIALRDKNDSSRENSPLKIAKDAILIDSTNLTPEEVVDKMAGYIGLR